MRPDVPFHLYGTLHSVQIEGFVKSPFMNPEALDFLDKALGNCPQWFQGGELLEWTAYGEICPIAVFTGVDTGSTRKSSPFQGMESVARFENLVVPFLREEFEKTSLPANVLHALRFRHTLTTGLVGIRSRDVTVRDFRGKTRLGGEAYSIWKQILFPLIGNRTLDLF